MTDIIDRLLVLSEEIARKWGGQPKDTVAGMAILEIRKLREETAWLKRGQAVLDSQQDLRHPEAQRTLPLGDIDHS